MSSRTPGANAVRYAELHSLSNFTFLRGASHPEELVETAAALGYEALAITDECSLSGIVRAHMAAKECGLKKLIIGSEFRLRSGRKLVVLAQNRNGYASLCQLITDARRAADKGDYRLTRQAFESGLPDCLVLW
ncbi:MAG: PHP domain-containing protein, partial [Gammaproteobacteria bacterium]|nr:PHP domain-containing protein [Gammaproteobacteria bacterium]